LRNREIIGARNVGRACAATKNDQSDKGCSKTKTIFFFHFLNPERLVGAAAILDMNIKDLASARPESI